MPAPFRLTIQIRTYVGQPQDRLKVDKALELLARVVNSSAFRARVIGFTRYTYAEGLSSEEIYNRIMTGDRQGNGTGPRTLSFDYQIVAGGNGSVYGYRLAGTDQVVTYGDRFNEMDLHDLVTHLGHEVVGHLAGDFGHRRWRMTRSVPYMVDEFIDDLLDD